MKKVIHLVVLVLVCLSCFSFAANPLVVMETNFGDITCELYPDKAPLTVENFLSYVNGGFYDGLVFHRVIAGFIIQSGAYYVEGNTIFHKGATNPPIINESDNGLSNLRGTLAMGRTNDPHSATTHFYINHVDNTFLDRENSYDGHGYCVFGAVVEGMDVVDAISQVPICNVSPMLSHFPCDPTVDIIRIYEKPQPMAYRPVFVAMSKQGTGLVLKGNPRLTVITEDTDTKVDQFDINSSAPDAMLVQGNASIFASKLNISGGLTVKGNLDYPDDIVISENLGFSGITPDMFNDIEPSYAGLPDLCPVDPDSGKTLPVVISGGEAMLEPGYYSAGVIIEDAAVSCLSGIYHLGGGPKGNGGFVLKGGAVVDANEVLFHLVEGAQVSIGNDAILTASAPTDADYKGFQFFQSPDNTAPAVFNGMVNCAGIWYFPSNHTQISGQATCSMLMADTIELAANANLTVDPSL